MSFKGGSKGGAAPALFNNPGYKSTNNIQFRGQDKPQSSALGQNPNQFIREEYISNLQQ